MERTADLFLFRLAKLASVSGQPLVRLCEGKYGITRREWRLIVVLSQEGPLLSTALARRASIEPARTSRTVTQLVVRGLAERIPRSNDRRCIEIHLTQRARDIYADLYPVVREIEGALLAGLSAQDRAELSRLLSMLESTAGALVPPEELPKADRRKLHRK
ncbi:MarR family transcriptional regulator [Pseudacidovorax intermedius]|uniref:MarR family transcriptional regulator n=1 Tax=Pseudacidovorax intermedius TaxID=433924 RepID=UPI0026ED72EB|nr:MarR family transcriptional regulator [Pseudacidovorax intermedius]